MKVRGKQLIAAAGLILLAGSVLTGWHFSRGSRADTLQAPLAPAPDDQGNTALHPLMIEAIRSRQYTASPIMLERDLGSDGSYSSKLISYRSDGLKVYALMNVPSGPEPPGGWPVIILNHGYIPPDQYRTLGGDYSYWIGGLSRRGFMVIKLDYRGHGDSEGEAEGGHWSPVYTYDLLNLIQSLKQYPLANTNGIGVVGHSMGANVALRAIVSSKDIKAAAFLAGVVGTPEDLFYNWRRTTTWRPPVNRMSGRQKLVEAYGEPKDNPDFWAKVSAHNYLDYTAGPVQIHHGTNDESVPQIFSDHLHKSLQKAGKSSQYFVYEGGDHQFSGNSDLALNRMLELFNRALK